MTDDLDLNKISEGYPDPKQDAEDNVDWLTFPQPKDEDFTEEVTMVGESKIFSPQKEPTSVAKINAEVKNVTQELNEVDTEQRRVAAIRYAKTNGISQKEAVKILSQDAALMKEWINY